METRKQKGKQQARCPGCERWLPVAQFYAYKKGPRKGALLTPCKGCRKTRYPASRYAKAGAAR
jgi:hypothetical protein